MSNIKLQDIANELGLSVSTVSRALNGTGRVSRETRNLVAQYARKHGYTVNEVARSLRLHSTSNIGIIVPDIANSFFSSVIKAAQSLLHENGYTLTVFNTNEDIEIEETSLRSILQKQVDGLIFASVSGSTKAFENLEQSGIPVVLIDKFYCQYPTDMVSYICFTAEQDRATLESDSSGSAGLRGRRSSYVSSFSFDVFSAMDSETAMPSLETKAINSGGLGTDPQGDTPVMQYT